MLSKPFCHRCLLAAMPSQAALASSIRELIDLLPPDARAPETLRRGRLDACSACDRLIDGTCALCGCYVELRAAKSAQRCPDLPPKW